MGSKSSKASKDKPPVKIFFCPKCGRIPQIKLKKRKFVEIHCQCFEIEERFNQIKETGEIILKDPEVINENISLYELSKYKSYTIPIEVYLKEIEKKKEPFPCNYSDHNKKKSKSTIVAPKSEVYCTECNKWICSKCLIVHNTSFNANTLNEHKTIIPNGLIINSLCENDDYHNKRRHYSMASKCSRSTYDLSRNTNKKGTIQYYCEDCHLHLCYGCYSKRHNMSHKLINLEDLFNSKRKSFLEKELKKSMDILDSFKLLYKSTKNPNLIEKIETDSKIINFFFSLIETRTLTKGIYNYNAVKNTLINQISREDTLYDYLLSNHETQPFLETNYVTYSNGTPVNLLSHLYNRLNDTNCILYLDGYVIPFSTQQIFNKKGKHKAYFQLRPGVKIDNISNMFNWCVCLSEVNFSYFHLPKIKDLSYLFYKCSTLTSVNFGKIDTSEVTTLEKMFQYCTMLPSIDLNNFITFNVISMEALFYECTSLVSVGIQSFETSNVKNMKDMFNGCRSLFSVDLSNFNTINVEDFSGMFQNCSFLNSVNISSFDTLNLLTVSHMFDGCISLTALDISNFNTIRVRDFSYMLFGCNSLIYFEVGKNFNTSSAVSVAMMLPDNLIYFDIRNLITNRLNNFKYKN